MWELFLRTHQSITRQLESDLRTERGLKMPWYDVLIHLHDAGGRLRMAQLADRVLFSTSGLTRLLDRMEAAGLVAREPCEDDRRGFWAVLKEAGRERLETARRTHVRGIHRIFLDRLDDAEVETLDRIFTRLLDSTGQSDASGAP